MLLRMFFWIKCAFPKDLHPLDCSVTIPADLRSPVLGSSGLGGLIGFANKEEGNPLYYSSILCYV